MLTLLGQKMRFCDGVTRRSFLQAGALTFGATTLSLTDIFRAEARAGTTGTSHKGVINIFLGGGPPHQDMWDIKTEAPPEIRGEFKPINTNVTGIQIGECFPRIAARMDKFAVIRSVVGARGGHDALQCMAGWDPQNMISMGGRPSIGAAASQGPRPGRSVRAAVRRPRRARRSTSPGATAAGPASSASLTRRSSPTATGMANLKLRNITFDQLTERRQLVSRLRQPAPRHDRDGSVGGLDSTPGPGHRRADLEPAARRPRPGPGERQGPASATATASRTSSSSTAPRPATSTCCWRAV